MSVVPMEKRKEKPVELEDKDTIEFDPILKNLGRAEFDFCARTVKGRVVEVHITRRQQTREPSWYVVKLNAESFCVKDSRVKNTDGHVAPWAYNACTDHRIRFSVYVPEGSTALRIRKSSVYSRFEFE